MDEISLLDEIEREEFNINGGANLEQRDFQPSAVEMRIRESLMQLEFDDDNDLDVNLLESPDFEIVPTNSNASDADIVETGGISLDEPFEVEVEVDKPEEEPLEIGTDYSDSPIDELGLRLPSLLEHIDTLELSEEAQAEIAPISEALAAQAEPEGIDKERLDKHILLREGKRLKSYGDSLENGGKLTGGIGHLLVGEEKKLYPRGSDIPEAVVMKWYEDDIQKAENSAKEQANQVPDSTPEFEEALVSLNFQLGTSWHKKFPTAWKHMKAGDYDRAAEELKYTKEGSGVYSDWYKQTPVRVNDMLRALGELNKE